MIKMGNQKHVLKVDERIREGFHNVIDAFILSFRLLHFDRPRLRSRQVVLSETLYKISNVVRTL